MFLFLILTIVRADWGNQSAPLSVWWLPACVAAPHAPTADPQPRLRARPRARFWWGAVAGALLLFAYVAGWSGRATTTRAAHLLSADDDDDVKKIIDNYHYDDHSYLPY